MRQRACLLLVALLAVVGGCASIVMDRSPLAIASGDLTLALSACHGMPEVGFDACRVTENEPIESVWRLYFPDMKKPLKGGEVNVYFHDVQKTYAITGPLLEIPWADFFEDKVWHREYDGTARALGIVRYQDANGVEDTIKVRGEARILVLKAGYAPMPVGSGFAGFKTRCKIEYSTAGRAAVECK